MGKGETGAGCNAQNSSLGVSPRTPTHPVDPTGNTTYNLYTHRVIHVSRMVRQAFFPSGLAKTDPCFCHSVRRILDVAGRADDYLEIGLEEAARDNDEATLTLANAARESGYSTDHLGRLVRSGKTSNAGRPGAPRISRGHLPRDTCAATSGQSGVAARAARGFDRADRAVRHRPRRLMMARTKRRRRSYSAGEWAGTAFGSSLTPRPASYRSSGARTDAGEAGRSGTATGTGPRGRRTRSPQAAPGHTSRRQLKPSPRRSP